ncbi:methyltransferase domain-containing protein [bacterium]|nr:methyltransferase domain-containing protein [bacterium]
MAQRRRLRQSIVALRNATNPAQKLAYKWLLNHVNLRRNRRRSNRRLEIGPGHTSLVGFETANITVVGRLDYLVDAAKPLPFRDAEFDLIYASHILEHVPWYRTVDVLREWARVTRPGGRVEIWVPDGLKIAKAFVDAESGAANDFRLDGWYKFNPNHDPCVWANGRMFSYGDGAGTKGDPNWHLALFSLRHLSQCLREAGFGEIVELPRDAVRGDDHGWINLGVTGVRLEL